MNKRRASAKDLTDEEVLKEFVKRFECDGAVLIYLDSNTELGFGRWRNTVGRRWVKDLFKTVKQDISIDATSSSLESGTVVSLS